MQPHGILLVTGPTGCGKTTTLYTALDRLNKPDVKILTVEDPVEYQMAGINQIQVKPQIDLTFANALRSIVRQDPGRHHDRRDPRPRDGADRRAVGADRPPGAVDGAHQRRARRTVNRLLDMGVEDYLLTSTVVGILAQRLVRTLCHALQGAVHARCPSSSSSCGLRKFATASDDHALSREGLRAMRATPATRAASASSRCCR